MSVSILKVGGLKVRKINPNGLYSICIGRENLKQYEEVCIEGGKDPCINITPEPWIVSVSLKPCSGF